MDSEQATEIIQRGARMPEVLVSDKYIEAQLGFDRLVNLAIQMGPNCNRECAGCYGFFGPKRKGLPKRQIVEKALAEAEEAKSWRVNLTDGEPFRHENREVMGVVAKAADKFSLNIMTNAVFARTQKNANNWIEFMKANGWSFGIADTTLQVSFGAMYNVYPFNYYRLNCALRDSFPEADYGLSLHYALVRVGESGEQALTNHVASCIHNSFASGKEPRLSYGDYNKESQSQQAVGYSLSLQLGTTKNYRSKLRGIKPNWSNKERGLKCCEVNVGTETPVPIILDKCDPDGRAVNSYRDLFDRESPVRNFKLDEILFHPDLAQSLWLGHDGNVAFGQSASCVRRGRIYGNVNDTPLAEIKERINNDPVFRAYELGGARFMVYLAGQEEPGFSMIGRINCGLCQRVFANPERVERIRRRIADNPVRAYLEYAERTNLVQSQKRLLKLAES